MNRDMQVKYVYWSEIVKKIAYSIHAKLAKNGTRIRKEDVVQGCLFNLLRMIGKIDFSKSDGEICNFLKIRMYRYCVDELLQETSERVRHNPVRKNDIFPKVFSLNADSINETNDGNCTEFVSEYSSYEIEHYRNNPDKFFLSNKEFERDEQIKNFLHYIDSSKYSKHKQVFVLVLEGYQQREIAESLGVHESRVSQIMKQVIGAYKNAISDK